MSTLYAAIAVMLWVVGGGALGVVGALGFCLHRQRRQGDYSTAGGMAFVFQTVVGPPVGGLVGAIAGLCVGLLRVG